MADWIVLETEGARAEIVPRGAELRRWSVDGIELLWEPDPSVWPAVSPILFPLVGWARDGRIRVDGRSYEMGVHGFAAHEDFDFVESGADFARLSLRDNAETRACYPFGFVLEATYRLAGRALSVALDVRNTGDRDLPYACGLHPGFRWPLTRAARQAHSIVFDRDESPDVPRIAPGGLFSSDTRPAPLQGRALPLFDSVFADEALCFLDANSDCVEYLDGSGARLRIGTSGFRHWAFWSRPPAPFVCIESWTGHGDPVGFNGYLTQKPSMILLAPGATRRHEAVYAFSKA